MLRVKKKQRRLVCLAFLLFICSLLLVDFTPEIVFSDTKLLKLSNDVYVISAFWEDRQLIGLTNFVRILTIAEVKYNKLFKVSPRDLTPRHYQDGSFDVTCEILTDDNKRIQGNINATIFEETLETDYAGSFFNCHPLASELRSLPKAVILTKGKYEMVLPVQSIRTDKHQSSQSSVHVNGQQTSNGHLSNELPSDKNIGQANIKKGAAVCVRALFRPYDNLKQLGQFISYYNKVLGATKFSFYLLEVTPRIAAYLAELQAMEDELSIQLRIVEWSLPNRLRSWNRLWDYGALTLLTDCLYSGMAEHEWTYIVDLDEFIVPKLEAAPTSVADFVTALEEESRPPKDQRSEAFLFRNTFFCAEYNEDEDFEEDFSVFNIINRQESLWSFKLRAKMLVRSASAIAVGHHRIHDWVDPRGSFNTPVPFMIGLLHHYRACKDLNLGFNGMGPPVLRDKNITDVSILRYRSTVTNSKVMNLTEKYA